MVGQAHALVTNDDGIDSRFLHLLVEALRRARFDVSVVAPVGEQSWIGRAISRRGELEARRASDFPSEGPAWTVTGTPSDCVNIALGHLLPRAPDIVVSGLNLGFNTTEMLILSSGTVAGAMEGAIWGFPAVAFSQAIPKGAFADLHASQGRAEGPFAATLRNAADRAAAVTRETLAAPPPDGCVVNVNFPTETAPETPVDETVPARARPGSLFEAVGGDRYVFRYTDGETVEAHPASDRAALARGHISRSVLDFANIGQRELPER